MEPTNYKPIEHAVRDENGRYQPGEHIISRDGKTEWYTDKDGTLKRLTPKKSKHK